MSRRLRQCADGPDQRRQLRGSDLREHDRHPRGARARRDPEAGSAGRSPHQRADRRTDDAQGNGAGKSRLSGAAGMRSLGALVVAILVAIISLWLFIMLLGLALKLVAILIAVGLAVAAYFAAERLITGGRGRA